MKQLLFQIKNAVTLESALPASPYDVWNAEGLVKCIAPVVD